MGKHLSPMEVVAITEQMPAACPACGGKRCAECSQTGQAEFCRADVGTRPQAEACATDLHGLARTEGEIAAMLALADGRMKLNRTPYCDGFADGVAEAIRWITGEIDDLQP